MAVLVVGLCVLAGLWLLLQRSRFGIETRAAADNAAAARGVGIRSSRIYAQAFALGSAMAAAGGVMGAELLPIEANYPLKHLVLFLAVVAVGGRGNPLALLGAALLLATVETAAKYFVPELSSILFFAAMLLVLSIRPAGLFATGN
jgi:branched-chain amino acid transport system permease protein